MVVNFRFKVNDLVEQKRFHLSDLILLKEWLQNTDLPAYDDEFLVLFLIACKNDLENTKKCARNYYLSRKDAPELFNDRSLTRRDIQHQLKNLEFCILPVRTDEGNVIMLHRLVNTDPSEYHMEIAMKILFMTVDTTLYDDPPKGLIALFDMRGVGIMHLTRVKLSAVRKFFNYVQEALPLQLQAIHVMNTVWFFDKILKLIKPFYKPELLQLLHTHTSEVDMRYFYETCIPRKCLPHDYGGNLPPVEELHIQNQRKLEELCTFFQQEEAMRR